jgi:hypothetical protein
VIPHCLCSPISVVGSDRIRSLDEMLEYRFLFKFDCWYGLFLSPFVVCFWL